MRKSFAVAVGAGAVILGSLAVLPAGAQTTQTTQTTQTVQTQDTVGPHSRYCGAWMNGTWTPNGNCTVETTTTTTVTTPAGAVAADQQGQAVVAVPVSARVPQRISGKIIGVSGHMVTLQHGDQTLIVDDSRALSREDTGRVATGRTILAHGYWEDGTFYANRFE